MELASRDVISRAEQIEIDEGRGVDGNVLLDLRHLGAEKIIERLHGTRELSMVFAGVDPDLRADPRAARPHYHMEGVDTDLDGKTALEGLYAAGECACVSVHGANRLGGTPSWRRSPTASAPAARPRTGRWRTPSSPTSSALADAERELQELGRREGERPHAIRDEMASTMHENFGVFRREADAGRARSSRASRSATSASWSIGLAVYNTDLTQALELVLPSLRPAWWRRGSPARRAAAPTPARTTIPTATTRTS